MNIAHVIESGQVVDGSTSRTPRHPALVHSKGDDPLEPPQGVAASQGINRHALAWAGILGPILFTLLFWAQEAVRRAEYNPLVETVSALEAGPHGWVQQINFVVFGLLTIGQAIGLQLNLRPSHLGFAGPALLGVSAIGLILAAALPLREDAAGTTFDPGGHVFAGVTFFCSSALALIVLSRRMRRDRHWSELSAYTLAAGVVALIGFVTMAMLVLPDTAPLHSWAGAAQRMLILMVLFPCRVALGVRALRNRTHAHR